MRKNIAVILAGGIGERAGFSRPKQLVKLAGRPVIAHTLERFQNHDAIDEIAIVTNEQCEAEIADLVSAGRVTKVKRLLLGGKERHESSLAAIRAYEKEALDTDIRLIFHDAVRPLVSEMIITAVVSALDYYSAVDVAIAATDTVLRADPDSNTICDVPDRREMRLGQTPQAFHYDTIRRAYDIGLKDPNFRTTDDCGVVLKYLPGDKIYIVEGASDNLKLTYPQDLLIIDKYLQTNAGRRVDAAPSSVALSALKGKSIVIFGGSSGIGASMARLAQAHGARVAVASRSNGVDVNDYVAVAEFIAQQVKAVGSIDAVVVSAARLIRVPLNNMSVDDIAVSVATNYTGALYVAKAAFEHLAKSAGQLLYFSSSSYTYGRANYAAYSSSKAAIVNLTQALAEEWASAGVRVNCINPDRTGTPMRTMAFGAEPPETLLHADDVARRALMTLTTAHSGYIFDIKKT
ncbi:bifunctional cytidylyltransferase/SDR family oxidoreductase [Rhizobium tumorigenes]|uniref:bifunctional cytidylyltransferase/SDR family oxidoreductase n=1 Tax=Rhizobium tumorigenes TaxID=2041385 RepID=UPI00241CCDC7|nr:bifunctional cytidylyltransferase/SDR family oxidoreductase [Rhizobium tumorigenes]WFS02716.1 bifunctional cytidylyltransferase/SDR family oxidoreductase [Rhizobium tumorigenes]